MTIDHILAAARAAIGTPFRHQGRAVGKALDCAGLLAHVAIENGHAPVDVAGYPRQPDGRLADALAVQPFLIRVAGRPQAGDFVLFHYEDDAHAGHLGICAGATLIHAWAHARKVCEHDFTEEWQHRVVAVYCFKELSDGR